MLTNQKIMESWTILNIFELIFLVFLCESKFSVNFFSIYGQTRLFVIISLKSEHKQEIFLFCLICSKL